MAKFDAVQAWEDLGRSWDWYAGHDSGTIAHPVRSAATIDALTDEEILAQEPSACSDELIAISRALAWGREALADMRSLGEALERAETAHGNGDRAGCLEALEEARAIESRYGDDPATAALRRELGVDWRVHVYRGPGGWYYAAWDGDEFDHADALDCAPDASEAEALAAAREGWPGAEIRRVADVGDVP